MLSSPSFVPLPVPACQDCHRGTCTIVMTCWCSVFELSRHPDKEAKLLAEVDAFGGKVPGVEDLEV